MQNFKDGLRRLKTRTLWYVFNMISKSSVVRVGIATRKFTLNKTNIVDSICKYTDSSFSKTTDQFSINVNQLKPEFKDHIDLTLYILFEDCIKEYYIDRLFNVPTCHIGQHRGNNNEWQFCVNTSNMSIFDELFLKRVISYETLISELQGY